MLNAPADIRWDWLVLWLDDLTCLRFHRVYVFSCWFLIAPLTSSFNRGQSSLSMKKLRSWMIFNFCRYRNTVKLLSTVPQNVLPFSKFLSFLSLWRALSQIFFLHIFADLWPSICARWRTDSQNVKLIKDDDKAQVKSIISWSMRRTIGSFDGIELTNQR